MATDKVQDENLDRMKSDESSTYSDPSQSVAASRAKITDSFVGVQSSIVIQTFNNHDNKDEFSKSQILETGEKLKTALKKKVKSIASEKSSLADFSERPIIPVDLSMVSKPQQIDDEFEAKGHYHRREDFAKVYQPPTSDITAEQIFTLAKQKAQEEADKMFTYDQEDAKLEYVEKHGNIVGVVGQAGIGKTTSAKKWTVQALSQKLFGEISFFFYIVVRNINFETGMTFLQFLLHTMLPEWSLSDVNVANAILANIIADPNVLLVFDGVDESVFQSFSSLAPYTLLDEKNSPEYFLKHLLGGKLLPHSRKIFTSRPAPFYNLHPSHRPRFIIEILGLSPNAQRELGKQICGPRYDLIQTKLQRNSNLYGYCYVPVNFILTAHYLLNYDGDIQLVSLTQVLANTCVQYSQTDHLFLEGQHHELDKLAGMAFDGFQNQKIIFEPEDFKQAGISHQTTNAFLKTLITTKGNMKLTILEGHKRVNFSHLIWQEFFAAVHLMIITSVEDFKKHHRRFYEDRWEVVTKFVFGICRTSVFNDLKIVIPGCSRVDWKTKKSLLIKVASSRMKNPTKETILQGCSWSYDANDDEITSSVSMLLPDELDFSSSSLLPNDAEMLAFVIQRRCNPLKKLDLSFNKIGDRGAASLAKCIHNISEEIFFQFCELTSVGADHISGKILLLKKPLKILNLASNKIGDEGAVSFGKCLANIEELVLPNCGLTCAAVEHLSGMIRLLQKPLKTICLRGNSIGDEGSVFVTNCLDNIEKLVLIHCDLKKAAAKHLSKKIRCLKKPLKVLNLSINEIGDKGALYLAQCIGNIEELYLCECELTFAAAKYFSKKIRLLQKPMKLLNLNYNKLTNGAVVPLAACVHNIEDLQSIGCGLTRRWAGKHL